MSTGAKLTESLKDDGGVAVSKERPKAYSFGLSAVEFFLKRFLPCKVYGIPDTLHSATQYSAPPIDDWGSRVATRPPRSGVRYGVHSLRDIC